MRTTWSFSSKDEYINFDMNANEDTKAFDSLNHGATEVIQPVRANAYQGEGSYDQYNKYAGVPLEGIGYLQVAINSQQFQHQIDEKIHYIAANRHIGQTGYVIIANLQNTIISSADGSDGEAINKTLDEVGLKPDQNNGLDKAFTASLRGDKHFCIARFVEGYYIIGVVPTAEVQSFRNRAALTNTITELVIFALMFFLIKRMISSIIISRIHNINHTLNKICEGELDRKVDEYSTQEFTELSKDINQTMDSLKDYMEQEKQKIKQELEYAKSIQMSALPKPETIDPYRPNYELYAMISTAKEVGGDFYDFYMLDDSRLAILIADVSGKGVPAALFMMTCKTLIKNLVESGLPLEKAMTAANNMLCENNDADMFVTVWMGILDLKSGAMQYVNAVHNQPVVFDENGEFVYLDSKPEFVLAGMPGLQYHIQTRQLRPGDKLFLYTDGVTEANNPRKEMDGEKRLLEYLNSAKNDPLSNMLHGLRADIDRFAEDAEQYDDITMLSVCYHAAKG